MTGHQASHNGKRGRVWITWERQRRSAVLADHFGCTFFQITESGWLRYPKSIARTLRLLLTKRPTTLAVQNPSMVLATIAVAWARLTNTFVIVDRHTTFLLNREYRLSPWLILFKMLNRFTLRFADITIVTNAFLADLVRGYGGRPYVLPDKLPNFDACGESPYPVTQGVRNVLLISSFADDEPIQEVIEGVSLVRDPPIHLYVSGNYKTGPPGLVNRAPRNVTFTGYLSDTEFIRLLCTVDIVVVLTSADHTMLCGCYEAVAAGNALVTSDKDALRNYFRGAFFVDNTAAAIAAVLSRPHREVEACKNRMRSLKSQLELSWEKEAAGLASVISAQGAERAV